MISLLKSRGADNGVNENKWRIIRREWSKIKRRFTWFADSGAAEDDHLDSVYVCHQLRGLSVIRAGLASHIASAADAPIITLCTFAAVLTSWSSIGHWHPLARAKGPMSFSSTREQSRHTCRINYYNEQSIICSSHHCSIPRRYNYRSLINLWRTPLNSLSFPYKRVREKDRKENERSLILMFEKDYTDRI